jgi:UDP-glucose 4-epimerase
LVTGGLGFIGHHVVAELESQGHDVVITDTQTTYGIVPRALLDNLIAERRGKIKTDRIYGVDVADQDGIAWLMRMHQPHMVVHLASFPRQKIVNQDPQQGSRGMSQGLLNLLQASSDHQVQRFVYVSSSMVYGNFTKETAHGIDENHATNPLGSYAIMKLAGEWLVRDYTRTTGMAHTILRPSAVYGPRDLEDRVVSKFLTAAHHGQVLQVNGANEALDFTYVDDAARGIAQATLSENACNNTYNISRGHAISLQEAAELAIDIAGQGSLQINGRDKDFPERGTLNTVKAQLDFGYEPLWDIETGFRACYEWISK